MSISGMDLFVVLLLLFLLVKRQEGGLEDLASPSHMSEHAHGCELFVEAVEIFPLSLADD